MNKNVMRDGNVFLLSFPLCLNEFIFSFSLIKSFMLHYTLQAFTPASNKFSFQYALYKKNSLAYVPFVDIVITRGYVILDFSD